MVLIYVWRYVELKEFSWPTRRSTVKWGRSSPTAKDATGSHWHPPPPTWTTNPSAVKRWELSVWITFHQTDEAVFISDCAFDLNCSSCCFSKTHQSLHTPSSQWKGIFDIVSNFVAKCEIWKFSHFPSIVQSIFTNFTHTPPGFLTFDLV